MIDLQNIECHILTIACEDPLRHRLQVLLSGYVHNKPPLNYSNYIPLESKVFTSADKLTMMTIGKVPGKTRI